MERYLYDNQKKHFTFDFSKKLLCGMHNIAAIEQVEEEVFEHSFPSEEE